jgi:hypothetical protein
MSESGQVNEFARTSLQLASGFGAAELTQHLIRKGVSDWHSASKANAGLTFALACSVGVGVAMLVGHAYRAAISSSPAADHTRRYGR